MIESRYLSRVEAPLPAGACSAERRIHSAYGTLGHQSRGPVVCEPTRQAEAESARRGVRPYRCGGRRGRNHGIGRRRRNRGRRWTDFGRGGLRVGLIGVEPLRQHPVPVVAQGEPQEREHVKIQDDDEYLLPEGGRKPLLGLRFRRLGLRRRAARSGLLLRCVHLPAILRQSGRAASVFSTFSWNRPDW